MQVYLTESQRDLLTKKAAASGASVAELIRRAIDRYLGGPAHGESDEEILIRTLGALPDLEVPARAEWDRRLAAEDPPAYG